MKIWLKRSNSKTFNKKLTETRIRFEKEKAAYEKEFKKEIKEWKRELGNER